MSKFSTRLTIVGACIAVTAGLMASAGAAATAIPGITVNDAKKTMTLTANVNTATTILVPDGYTLDGKGFTITAVDGPTGTSFEGAVVQNEGTGTMNVKNLKIEGGVPNNCVAVFNGVAFINSGGSIKNVTLNNIGQTTGCQSGRAIYVENTDASASARKSVTIEGNTVWHYNKNGIDVRGNVDATILGNTVTGNGPVDYIAQNGIVVYGALTVAQVGGNKVSGNYYTPADTEATGILVIGAHVSIDRKNILSGNETDIYNAGYIGGKFFSA